MIILGAWSLLSEVSHQSGNDDNIGILEPTFEVSHQSGK